MYFSHFPASPNKQTHIDNVDVNFSLLKKEVAPSQLQLDTWLRRHYKENSVKVSLKVNTLHYFPTIKTYDNNKFLSSKYELVAEISNVWIGHVNNIPTMHYFTGISRNTQSLICNHWLRVYANSYIMHCGILRDTHWDALSAWSSTTTWSFLNMLNPVYWSVWNEHYVDQGVQKTPCMYHRVMKNAITCNM